MAGVNIAARLVVVKGPDETQFSSFKPLFATKGDVTLQHFVGGTGYVLYEEDSQASGALAALDGHQEGGCLLQATTPSVVEVALVEQVFKVQKVEELLTTLGLTGSLTATLPVAGQSTGSPQQGPQLTTVTGGSGSVTSTSPASSSSTPPQPSSSVGFPKLPYFSGCQDRKDDVSFDLWAFEVRCLLQEQVYTAPVLAQAVRRSLRGAASNVLLHLGQGASVEAILQKLEGQYGTVISDAALLQMFYAEKQKADEAVASWASRLEDTIAQLKKRGKVTPQAAEEMLRNKFWVGLCSHELKMASRHKFDDVACSYSELLAYTRSVELEASSMGESQHKTRQARASQAVVDNQSPPTDAAAIGAAAVEALKPMLDKVVSLLTSQQERVVQHQVVGPQRTELQANRPHAFAPPPPQQRKGCFRCGGLDHVRKGCRAVLPAAASGNAQFPLPESWQQGEVSQTSRD